MRILLLAILLSLLLPGGVGLVNACTTAVISGKATRDGRPLLWKNRDTLDASNLSAIGIGFAVSFVVALAVVKGFVALVSRFGFAPFAWYRIIAGSAALVWLAMR